MIHTLNFQVSEFLLGKGKRVRYNTSPSIISWYIHSSLWLFSPHIQCLLTTKEIWNKQGRENSIFQKHVREETVSVIRRGGGELCSLWWSWGDQWARLEHESHFHQVCMEKVQRVLLSLPHNSRIMFLMRRTAAWKEQLNIWNVSHTKYEMGSTCNHSFRNGKEGWGWNRES